MTEHIRLRRESAANWTRRNPVLEMGEPGWEFDTGYLKVGNGRTAWADLSYVVGPPEEVEPTPTRSAVLLDPSATPEINVDEVSLAEIVDQDEDVTGFVMSGTPDRGTFLIIEITDDGTPRAIDFGDDFEASGTIDLPTTTVAEEKLTTAFLWNVTTSKYRCAGVS